MDITPMEVIFSFLGGLGIFLYGIKSMGDGLQAAAGDRLREILNRMTATPLRGILAGMLVTILIQSSSGTTVITIGLVSAGFMTLKQAIGVIMGANIGTTVTAFIIGLDIGEYALPVLAIGSFLLFFSNKTTTNNIGRILFGFGALFFGLELMGDGVKPLADLEAFRNLMLQMSDNRFLGLAVGTILTVIVQSSSATIAILQNFYLNDLVDLKAALPILLGDNIGTTITAVLAALVGSIAAKRAAAVHVIFNVVGAIIFIILLPLFVIYVDFLQSLLNLNKPMTIAFAHGSYNLINTLIQLPFIGTLAWIVTKIVPGKDLAEDYKPNLLDPILLKQSPQLATQSAQSEVKNLGLIVSDTFKDVYKYVENPTDKRYRKIQEKIQLIDNVQDRIRKYLMNILELQNQRSIDSENIAALLEVTRIYTNTADFIEKFTIEYKKKEDARVRISDAAFEGLETMMKHVKRSLDMTVDSIDIYNPAGLERIIQLGKQSNKIEHNLRQDHVSRLNDGTCSPESGAVYAELIALLERIGYNSRNISETILYSTRHELPEEFTIYD